MSTSMRIGIWSRWGVSALAFTLLMSCSLKVKVTENWERNKGSAIPLDEVTNTWNLLKSGTTPSPEALNTYNTATENAVVQIAKNWLEGSDEGARLRTSQGDATLHVNVINVPAIAVAKEVIPANFVHVRSGLQAESRVSGVGAPLIVQQPRSDSDPFIPDSGLWVPVTALLNLDHPHDPILELIDPTRQKSIMLSGRDFNLSADYTAAFARDFQERQLQFGELSGLLYFDQFAKRMGPYRMTPFDPAKEICFFVHGINSNPSTWDEVINRLYGDPAIRDRYEFWTFSYPTGAPIQYLAAEFRKGIEETLALRRTWGAKEQKITIVGHSMGGLLAKAATLSSGDEEWQKLFNTPLDQLDLSEKNKDTLRRMIYFQPIPEIRRVIFCAVPHGGSDMANQPAVQAINGLIKLPTQLLSLSTQVLARSASVLTPQGREFAHGRTSVQQLRAGAWTTAVFLNKPLNPQITYYSIIGNHRSAEVPVEKSSDGIVPYRSSHIEGAASELVVRPSGHAVHKTNAGMEEILRILKLP